MVYFLIRCIICTQRNAETRFLWQWETTPLDSSCPSGSNTSLEFSKPFVGFWPFISLSQPWSNLKNQELIYLGSGQNHMNLTALSVSSVQTLSPVLYIPFFRPFSNQFAPFRICASLHCPQSCLFSLDHQRLLNTDTLPLQRYLLSMHEKRKSF